LRLLNIIITLFVAFFLIGCVHRQEKETLFVPVSNKVSGVNFINTIKTNDSVNILNYEYLYNGGGVGIGDFNNDGLEDIIFTGNQVESKIYLNKGNLQFEDITKTSQINTAGKICTGVSIVDINQDGLDDIYLNVGGMGNQSVFPNLLYINNGDLTFTESAAEYGLADQGESIQALFFDYDLDGDLDMYLLTGGGFEKSAIMIRPMLKNGQSRNTDRLYRNDFDTEIGHPVYTDISKEAGITIEGFGLGVSTFDANNDNWPDIYVSNDYLSRDFLYINQQDGTFIEQARDYFGHTSHFSMGNDIADINNDGYLDVFTVDMLPEDVKRRKLMSGAHHSHDVFQIALKYGYGHQHMRNMLQLNNGNSTFSEIGQLTGLDKTDWSWAPLIADFDNDGLNDIFITNGFGKDITDMDFVKFRENHSSAFGNAKNAKKSVIDSLYKRPGIIVPNYAFKNKGGLKFEKVSKDWGFDENSLSNGAAYADLDNDGDLDLIVNNINKTAYIFKNTLREKDSVNTNYLKVKLQGRSKNIHAKGAKINLYISDSLITRYHQPVRGFQSTVGNTIHFGLGNAGSVDSLVVEWPENTISVVKDITVNHTISIAAENSFTPQNLQILNAPETYFKVDSTLQFKHQNKLYNDFNTQSLLLRKHSSLGPGMAVGDLNNDGLDDVFIGGTYGYLSTILYQTSDGDFEEQKIPETELYEDGGAVTVDANADGLLDLYVTSGGSERYAGHVAYQDRLYIQNNGQLQQKPLPEMLSSTSAVSAGDYDADGDLDLFVGGRVVPGKFPVTPESYILENENGDFKIVTQEVCPAIQKIGMVTSATWTDFDNDNHLDLVLVGEMMPVTFLKGNGESLENITASTGLPKTSGLWNSLVSADFDNDGDMDFIVGNLGLNSNLKIQYSNPIRLDYADFDGNGSVDPIFSKFEQGQYYPIASLDQLASQLPSITKKFRYYNTFARSSTQDLIDLFDTKTQKTLEAHELKSSYIENVGQGKFSIKTLPLTAQFAPVNGILPKDINQDGFLDVILAGNNFGTEVGMGRYDASFGQVLLNDGKGHFTESQNDKTGFMVSGDSRSLINIKTAEKDLIVVSRNNDDIKVFEYQLNSNSRVNPKSNESYAFIQYKDGNTTKVEFNLGQGYLSQSSNILNVTKHISKIEFFKASGEMTRAVRF
jgi:hypothetical protein